MPYIYAISDIHGELEIFKETLALVDLNDRENKLVLLGDYIGREEGTHQWEALSFIKDLQEKNKSQVIVLMGNHELMFLEDTENESSSIVKWLRTLPYIYETDTQIFVHAGIDEEAGEWWKYTSEDYYFCSKYPPRKGPFYKDIIAGHVAVSQIANDREYNRVYWDARNHFYIDGDVEITKNLLVLKYNVDTGRYSSFEKTAQCDGDFIWIEYVIK